MEINPCKKSPSFVILTLLIVMPGNKALRDIGDARAVEPLIEALKDEARVFK